MKSYQALQKKRDFIKDKNIIAIDPAKVKHQAVVMNNQGIQLGKPFLFFNDYTGYNQTLWNKTKLQIPDCNQQNTVFSIETSCNLWQTLAFYLFSKGYTVLLVSPLKTYHSRVLVDNDFSHTDPKDALLVASNTRDGYFHFYKQYSPLINAMHSLSIAYYKINKELSCNKARLRAFIQHHFPEFLNVLEPDTDTAMYLLKKYFLPQDFLNMNIVSEANVISKISHKQHGLNTLIQLQKIASNSIGVKKISEEILASRIILNSYINIIETLQNEIDKVSNELINLAKQTPYFDIIYSFKGISEKSTAIFIAEIRDLSLFNHFKQILKMAGFNLRLFLSGNSSYPNHISHIGNKRLAWILFRMTDETTKYIPEVRFKFLKRQIKRKNHTKNVISCVGLLLNLITSLVKNNRPYEFRPEVIQKLVPLEQEYKKILSNSKKKNNS